MKLQCPIPKILLPVDGSKHSKRAVQFAGYLGASMGKSLSGITLFHTLTGGYLSRHMENIDFRTKVLTESEAFRKIKETHINQDIKPFLDEGEKLLRESGVGASIERLIREGEAANEIIKAADEGKFPTIIMARRGLSELKGLFLGSVTGKVIHAATRQTVYIVGQRILKDKKCPIPRILIPVDGSSYSMRGVEHATCLAANLKTFINETVLLRVINMELFTGRLKEGIDSFDEAREILDMAKETLVKADLPGGITRTKIRLGRPSEEILKEAEEEGYDLIVLGRKGRTAIKDFLLGGVSTTVLHRCQNQTVAIVSTR